MNVRFWPILLKKSASVSTAEKYASEIEIRVLRRRFSSGLRFDVATCKKGVFTDQCMGSLAGSTFSTQSADCCLSSPSASASASASCSSQARGRPTLVLGPIASKPRIGSTGTARNGSDASPGVLFCQTDEFGGAAGDTAGQCVGPFLRQTCWRAIPGRYRTPPNRY